MVDISSCPKYRFQHHCQHRISVAQPCYSAVPKAASMLLTTFGLVGWYHHFHSHHQTRYMRTQMGEHDEAFILVHRRCLMRISHSCHLMSMNSQDNQLMLVVRLSLFWLLTTSLPESVLPFKPLHTFIRIVKHRSSRSSHLLDRTMREINFAQLVDLCFS